MNDINLPTLPPAVVDEHNLQGGRLLYSHQQMREYARAAVLADRKERAITVTAVTLRAALDGLAFAAHEAGAAGESLGDCEAVTEWIDCVMREETEARAALNAMIDTVERWLETGKPAGPDESRALYEQMCRAVGREPKP